MLQRLRDEAHRFAITYHRSLRGKDQVKSVLDEIPGVGPARRKALMKEFESIEVLRDASVEEIASIEGFYEALAQSIYDFFHVEDEL